MQLKTSTNDTQQTLTLPIEGNFQNIMANEFKFENEN